MKDKKNIVIVILVVIIFFGAGYILGTAKKGDNNEKKVEVKTSSSTTKTSSSTTQESSKESTSISSTSSKTEETSQVSNEQIAMEKMVSLTGRWAVPQSGSNIYIHEDGHWSTSGVGPGTDRDLNTQVHSFDQGSQTIHLTVDGKETSLQIVTDTEIIVTSGDGQSSRYVLMP